jgi:hypothetical protein
MGRSVKTTWVRFNNKDYKENPNLLIELLTEKAVDEFMEEIDKL